VPEGTWEAEGWAEVDPQGNRGYVTGARTVRLPRDPLAIDLDGDGIETIGLGANPTLFDHNADGIRTGTGWVTGDDAWLVLDRNASGTIDSGRELFGVDTLLSGTPGVDAVYASTGFEALRTLDANADNVFNAQDSAFTQVRLWRDLNQDGISQASELTTLAAQNIIAISLNASTTTINLGNGNTVSGTATVTRGNGSTTHVDAVGVAIDTTAGNLNLTNNPFYREFTTTVPLTTAARALPEMNGSGWVRDLREAMSLGTPQAQALTTAVQQFAAATTRDAQQAQLDNLLRLWAETNQTRDIGPVNDPLRRFVVSFRDPDPRQAALTTQMQWAMPILEVFNGMTVTEAGMGPGSTSVNGSGQTVTTHTVLGEAVGDFVAAYDAIKQSVYSALVVQTRLKPYLDAIDLVIDENGIHFDTVAVNALFASRRAANERNAFIDLVEFNQYTQATAMAAGFDSATLLRTWIDSLPTNSPIRADLTALHVLDASTSGGSALHDIYFGDSSANSFAGGAGNDVLDTQGGNDSLRGDAGNDLLRAGAGDDFVTGGEGNDVIDGGVGNDLLAGGAYDTWNGNYAGWGSDTYRFGLGNGQDRIVDFAYGGDSADGDAIEFTADVSPADVVARRVGNDLMLTVGSAGDSVRISEFFGESVDVGVGRIEEVRFLANGTVWNTATLMQMVTVSTTGNDVLIGYSTADMISGGDGNDDLRGRAGNDNLAGDSGNDALSGEDGDDVLDGGDGNDGLNGGLGADTLLGGAGDDTLSAWQGDDLLDGGAGNDTLYGGANDSWNGNFTGYGSDTYRFGRGAGQDTIIDYGYVAGAETDTVEIAADVLPSEVTVRHEGNDLVVRINGTTDRITVREFFSTQGLGSGTIEQLRFALDGTVWNTATLIQMVLVGTAAGETLYGYAGADTISGGDGADVIYANDGNDTVSGDAGADSLVGGNGNDTLLGGADNDTLQGGNGDDTVDGGTGNDLLAGGIYDTWNGNFNGQGSDTYRFGRGAGQDTVIDFNYVAGAETDTIELAADVAATDVAVRRVANDLALTINGTTDHITVREFFNDATNSGTGHIEQVRFLADGTVWNAATLMQMVTVGTSGADTLIGYTGNDVLSGGEGNDDLRGRAGNDNLAGDAGNDALSGEAGDDTLYGGDGDDSLNGGDGLDGLYGGAGNDTLSAWQGDDILDGGAGNDTLYGGANDSWNGNFTGYGNDTYRFGRGAGQDTIIDYGYVAGAETDTLEIASDVLPSDVTVRREGNDLVVRINGTTDRITVREFFSTQGLGSGTIEQLRFASDGTVWNTATLMQMVLVGTAAGETLYGYAGADTISGGDGADVIYGRDGNDTLSGDAGADVLRGENGNDTLLGGADNDTLEGNSGDDILEGGLGNDSLYGGINDSWNGNFSGYGSDTYRFGRGGGQDRIVDYAYAGGSADVDTIEVAADVSASDLSVRRVGNDLAASINGSADKITVSEFFNDATNSGVGQIDQVRLMSDGTVWNAATLMQMVTVSTTGNDVLIGYSTADTLSGGEGDDDLRGRAGNDSLSGDAGNDALSGEDGDDQLDGGAGNDTLNGGTGVDTLLGGAGDDSLSAWQGDDILDGGAGNDTLYGGANDSWNGNFTGYGNDTYRFGRGSGQDTVVDYGYVAGAENDTIEIAADVSPSEVTVRHEGNDLVLRINSTTDRITVRDFFGSQDVGSGAIDRVRFASDGTVWNTSTLMEMVLVGSAAGETLYGYAGADIIAGGNGADTIYGRDGNDTLSGDAGDDALVGENGNDNLLGGSGNDSLTGMYGDDLLDGGAGNDLLSGGQYDTWNGSYAGWGSDTYRFGRGSGQDTVVDYTYAPNAEIDTVEVASDVSSAELAVRRDGRDLVVSVAGTADSMRVRDFFTDQGGIGIGAIDRVRFAADNTVWDTATLAQMTQQGTPGNDTLIGDANNNFLAGGDGDDNLQGRAGNDGLSGDGGNDSLSGEDGNDLLDGGDGSDVLNGGTGSDTLLGGAGNDTLSAWQGDDILDGGAGNDTLYGGANDSWNGNFAGYGNDTYRFGRGAGQDTIIDYGHVAGAETDAIEIAADVSPSDVTIRREGNDLVLRINGTTDRISVRDFFGNQDVGSGAVDQIRFTADGTTWSTGALMQMVLLGSTAGETLSGYVGDDSIAGGDGNDVIYGRDGNDALSGDAGADVLRGENGNDTLLGGADNDTLEGSYGNDVLEGGLGNDNLYGGINDSWNGNFSGYGSDTYRFGRGAGQDRIVDYAYTGGGADVDTIEVAADVNASELSVRRVGNDLAVSINGSTDKITVSEFFNDATNSGVGQIDQVRLMSGGTVWNAAALMQMVTVGTPGADTLIGYTGNDVLSGGEGNDDLRGRAGNDNLAGDAGNDALSGEAGDDTLYGGDGDDSLNGGDGLDGLYGGAGNDTLSAWQGDDILDGGAGNDTLYGGANDSWNGNFTGYGNDTYRFGRGSGQDTIIDYGYVAGAEADTLEIASDVLPSDVTVRREGNDLVVRINGTTDRITVREFFGAQDIGSGAIDRIRFAADGTVWTAPTLMQMVLVGSAVGETLYGYASADTISGGDGADVIYANDGNDTVSGDTGADSLVGGNGNDTLLGGADNDTLQGGNGDDTLDGGTGNDLLAGGIYDTWNGNYSGYGSDTYRFGPGGGQDTILDRNGAVGEVDTISLGVGVGTSDVQLLRVNTNDLAVELVGTTDKITVSSHFNGATAGDGAIEQIRFADGTTWDAARIAASALTTVQGTAAAETLNGGTGADRLLGLDGNDTLNGNAGNDWLDGGLGTDTMRGGTGDDVYVVDATADSVTENASEGTDTVRASVTWTLGANVEHLVLTGTTAINGTGNALNNDLYGNSAANTLAGGAGNDRYYVGAGDTVTESSNAGTDTVFSTTTWTLGTNVEHLTLIGTAAINGTGNALANTLTGNDAANALNGGTGADTMIGGLGDDTYTVDNAGDVVTELADQGVDRVSASIAYTLGNNVENLTLTGTSGLSGTGNTLDNVIVGNSGANTLNGGAGNDRLDGGTGSDTMNGGTGNDTYVVNATGDIVNESADEGTDTVESLVTRTLGANQENLTLTGTSAISGTGNALDNVLTGNSAANTLTGGEGNDTYVGSAGNDTLNDTSTSSNEVYRWGVGQGNDTITDAGGNDRIEIGAGVTASQVILTRSTNDLRITLTGVSDVLTIKNWYTNTANRIEEIRLADGSTINAGTVAPLSVSTASALGVSARMWRADRPTSGVAEAVKPSAETSVRGTQLLVQAMSQFTDRASLGDVPAARATHWERPGVSLASPL
jgi:Ca2+-binding RTX toxin-like protein